MRAAGSRQDGVTEMQPSASTADYIAFHAMDRPGAAALIDGGRAISYAELDRDLRKFTSALQGFGLPAGSRAAVFCDSVHVHWLLLAACERLGIASASFGGSDGDSAMPLVLGADLVLAEPGFSVPGVRRLHSLAPQWLEDVLAAAGTDVSLPPTGPEDPIRLVRTSGTTGANKRLLLTRRMYDAWIDRWGWSLGVTHETRYLLTMPFASTGRHTLTNAVLRAGGTVTAMQFESVAAVADAIETHAINLMTLLPIQLKQMLDTLPSGFAKPADLTLATIGAAVAEPLVETAMRRLATEVVSYYGSNEIPFIAEMRLPAAGGLATLFPWVDAEIVDDAERLLPQGAAGWIRLKADTMPTGYLDDPETTRRMFRDGWFHPGDVGVLHGGRQLRVLGRGDELLNIGGKKIAPSDIEALVASHLEIADVGVCSLRNAEGVEEIYIAVAAAGSDDAELHRRIARALEGFPFGVVHPVKVPCIPRNANGKILRSALKEAVASVARIGQA